VGEVEHRLEPPRGHGPDPGIALRLGHAFPQGLERRVDLPLLAAGGDAGDHLPQVRLGDPAMSSVAQIHALLYLSDKPLAAEDIAGTLGIARSNVSNSLKDLPLLAAGGDAGDHLPQVRLGDEEIPPLAQHRHPPDQVPARQFLQRVRDVRAGDAEPQTLAPAVERFILHWGDLGGQWGVNRSVAQIHALLYLSDNSPVQARLFPRFVTGSSAQPIENR
jgi:hypothetical protein